MGFIIDKSKISNISRIKSLFYILNNIPRNLKIRLFFSLIFILIAGIFEAQTIRYISIFFQQIKLGFESNNISNFSTNSGLFAVFVLASAISRIFIFRFNTKLGASICNYVSSKIFKELIERDYEFSLNEKENVDQDLLTIQVTKLGGIINSFLISLSAIFISLFILFSIKNIGLFYIFILLLCFLIIYLFLGYFIKNKLRINSKVAIDATRLIVQKIQEISCLRSEINLGLNPKPFLADFNEIDKKARMVNASSIYLGYLPRYLIEGIFLASSIFIISIFYSQQREFITISVLGTLAFAFQKLLPNAQQIFMGWSILNANGDALIEISRTLSRLGKNSIKNKKNNITQFGKKFAWESISLENVGYYYKSDSGQIHDVFSSVSLNINMRQKIVLAGPSGTGKSTLIKLISGLIKPKSGQIFLDQANIHEQSSAMSNLKRLIAYVPQQTQILNKSIAYNLFLDSKNELSCDKSYLDKVLKCCFLEDFIKSQPNNINTVIGFRGKSISGGQKQRIAIARALLLKRDILILDEATSSLDQKMENHILNNIHEFFSHLTIIHISHNPETINRYSKKIFIEDLK